jgi:hypothetical protein
MHTLRDLRFTDVEVARRLRKSCTPARTSLTEAYQDFDNHVCSCSSIWNNDRKKYTNLPHTNRFSYTLFLIECIQALGIVLAKGVA